MNEPLRIIHYPDPRLTKASEPVREFGPELAALASRLFELMRESRGVGLAAPQAGKNVRLFVMNPTGKPEDDRVYVNPQLSDATDSEEDEEGCLSLPGITANIVRDKSVTMRAQDLSGKAFEEKASGYIARIWQHEFDHLNGILITDRMGSVAKMSHRKTLKELEEKFATARPVKRRVPRAAM